MTFWEFFTCLKEAKFGFGVIWDAIVGLYYAMTENVNISSIFNGFMEGIAPVRMMVMTLAVILCVIVALFGKKIIGVVKFFSFFVVGFALGTHFLAPLLPPDVPLAPWVVGLVVALLAAVLYRFVYIILYVAVVGYGAYILTYNVFYLQLAPEYSSGRALVCLVIALVVVIIALVLRKYIEMIGTAALGAWCATWVFANQIYNFTSWQLFRGNTLVAMLIPAAVIAIVGATVQIATRRRY